MISALEIRGYGHGSGIWNPESTKFLVNIPKNASSFLLIWANRHGWLAGKSSEFDSVEEVLIVLRDPIDRWISGISQYIVTYIQSVCGPNGPVFDGTTATKQDYFLSSDQFVEQYTDLTERILFDAASRFDDHVWPQSELIDGLLPNVSRTYFYLDQNLNRNIADYLGFNNHDDLDRNQGSDNPEQKKIQEFFRNRLLKRPELRQRLMRHYQNDYDLIGSVEFYVSK